MATKSKKVQAWLIWFVSVCVVILGYNLQTGYAMINESISKDLHISAINMGIIAVVYTWAFAIFQTFSGSILDVLGARRVFRVSVALIVVGAFCFASATSFYNFIVAQIFLAAGASFGFVGAGFIGGKWFPPAKFGIMFGLVQTLACFGSQLGQMLYTELLSHGVFWRYLLYGMSFSGLIIWLLVVLIIKDPKKDEKEFKKKFSFADFIKTELASLRSVWSVLDIWLVSIFGGISFGFFFGIAVYWGQKLLRAQGASFAESGYIVALVWLGLAVFSPLCNMISNRWHKRKPVMILLVLVQALSVVFLIYGGGSKLTLALGMLLFGIGASSHMLAFTVGSEVVSSKLIGTAASVINGTMFVLGGIAIGLPYQILKTHTGELDLTTLQSILWVYPVALVIAALVVPFIKETCKA